MHFKLQLNRSINTSKCFLDQDSNPTPSNKGINPFFYIIIFVQCIYYVYTKFKLCIIMVLFRLEIFTMEILMASCKVDTLYTIKNTINIQLKRNFWNYLLNKSCIETDIIPFSCHWLNLPYLITCYNDA